MKMLARGVFYAGAPPQYDGDEAHEIPCGGPCAADADVQGPRAGQDALRPDEAARVVPGVPPAGPDQRRRLDVLHAAVLPPLRDAEWGGRGGRAARAEAQ